MLRAGGNCCEVGFQLHIRNNGLQPVSIWDKDSFADTSAESDNLSGSSENLSQSLIDLLPDIEKIYRESLTTPFIKAESKIYDKDIAQFYRELLDNSVLSEPGSGTN